MSNFMMPCVRGAAAGLQHSSGLMRHHLHVIHAGSIKEVGMGPKGEKEGIFSFSPVEDIPCPQLGKA